MFLARLLAAGILTACVLESPCEAQDLSGESLQQQVNRADQKFRAVFNDESPPMAGASLVVIRNGAIVYEGNLGYADVAGKVAAGSNARYRIYSTAKSLTAVAAMRMAEVGMLNLDEPITQVMPELPGHLSGITPRHLMANRSGIRNYIDGEWIEVSSSNCDSPSAALTPFVDDPLIFEPGTANAYTTFGYVLLSAVMEEAYDGSYEDVMSRFVFEPAGMRGIAIEGRKVEGFPIAGSYLYEEGGEPEFFPLDQYDPPVLVSCKFGGGGFVGRAMDLAKFGDALLNGRLISEFARYQLWANISSSEEYPSYGLGFFDGDNWLASLDASQREESADLPERNFPETWFHGGSAAGGYSLLFIYPEHDLVLAMAATNRATDNFIMLDYHDIAAEFFHPRLQ